MQQVDVTIIGCGPAGMTAALYLIRGGYSVAIFDGEGIGGQMSKAPLIENYPPPAYKGKYIKIKYVSQLPDTQVPTFVFFANLPQYIKQPYMRFLENKLRETWEFHGTPILLFPRQK